MELFDRVLVAVDGSPPSAAAVRLAARFAAVQPQPVLRFISVFEPPVVEFGVDAEAEAEEAACRQALGAACDAAREAGIAAVSSVMRVGTPAREIVAEAETWDAACTVVGTHGRSGIAHAVFGSCAEGVLHRSVRPVLVAREAPAGAPAPFERVLCAFDGSPSARRAFDAAAALASARNGELHLLTVVQMAGLYALGYERDGFDPDGSIGHLYDDARRELKALAASTPGDSRVALHVVGGTDVPGLIVDCAAKARCGLIAMGTHGRGGLGRALLGSSAQTVIRDAAVPVLTFREAHQPLDAARESGASSTRR